jgi:hypothetical protein
MYPRTQNAGCIIILPVLWVVFDPQVLPVKQFLNYKKLYPHTSHKKKKFVGYCAALLFFLNS